MRSRVPLWYTEAATTILLAAVTVAAGWAGQGLWRAAPFAAQPHAGEGTLEVHVKDHREAISDFLMLEIDVESVRIHPKGAPRDRDWTTLKPGVERIDLTRHAGNDAAVIFRGNVAAGPYEALALKLKGLKGTLKSSKGMAPLRNRLRPIRLPFSVQQEKVAVIVLDLVVLDLTDHPHGGYELHIEGYELFTNGKLIDRVPPG